MVRQDGTVHRRRGASPKSSPRPLPVAPDPGRTPLPSRFGLRPDPSTRAWGDGSVLVGGSPLRLIRLSPLGRAAVVAWVAGAPVGSAERHGLLARRLVSGGLAHPRPPAAAPPWPVTVVIPVRDRPEQVRRLLGALGEVRCVVVDDGSGSPEAIASVAAEAGAELVVRSANEGPAAARNAGLASVRTPLVAFVDSDCEPEPGWLGPLIGHFADPVVGAVAPRVRIRTTLAASAAARYEACRSPLDLGELEGPVRPGTRLSYVPSAALVARRDALGPAPFDPELRGGEDVDLVWRLDEANWAVRYVPTSTVWHDAAEGPVVWLARRAFYGTTAGPLSERHPASLAPLVVSAPTAAAGVLLGLRRPGWAAVAIGVPAALLARRLRGVTPRPTALAIRLALGGSARAALPSLQALARAWGPALVVGLVPRRTRAACALTLVAPAARGWWRQGRGLGPLSYGLAHVADDLAYATGVWLGAARARTIRPLVPSVRRARRWPLPGRRPQPVASGPTAGGSS